MKKRRIGCLLMALVLLFAGLTACKGSGKEDPTDTKAGTAGAGTTGGKTDGEDAPPISGVAFRTEPSTVKVLQSEKFSSGSQTLTFKAFRNEYEGAQLILMADRDVTDYNVTVSDLTCGDAVLSKDLFEVYHEKYIKIETVYETLSGNEAGMYPDALLPLETAAEYGENRIGKGMNQGVWFTVRIPKDQTAGVYTGNFRLTVDGGVCDVPVEVTVWDYAISDETHQKSCYAFYYDALGMGELSNTNEMEELYTEALLNHRLNPRYLPVGLGDINPTDEELRLWYDSVVQYTQDARCSWICIPYRRVDGTLPSGRSSTSLVDIELYKTTLKTLLKRSLKEGVNLMEKLGMWINCLDEADYRESQNPELNKRESTEYVTKQMHEAQEELYAEYKKELDETGNLWMGDVHQCDKDFIAEMLEDMRTIQHFFTLTGRNGVDDSRFLFENPFTRCIQLSELHTEEQRAFLEAERARYNEYYNTDTGEIWTYTGVNPHSPYPTLHIDDDSLTLRSFGWFMKQYHIIGQQMWYTTLYYDMKGGNADRGEMRELQDCYGTAERFPTANGDGFIFYPGAPYGIEGPVGSIRLEVLRDSMEDYEVLYLMEETLRASVEKNGGVYTDSMFDGLLELLTLGYYDGLQVQLGDDVTNGFETLRESLVSVLKLLEMGVTVTEVKQNAALVTIGIQTPAGVTVSANGNTLTAAPNGQTLLYTLTADLTAGETLMLSATADGRTVEATLWLGVKQTAIPADGIAERITLSAPNSGSYVENDEKCGAPAYRMKLAAGNQETILNLADLGIDSVSQSLWLTIYNDSDSTVTADLWVKNADEDIYVQLYDRKSTNELNPTPAVRLTLEPGLNRVELSGYGLIAGTKPGNATLLISRGKAESLKLVWSNSGKTEICILGITAETTAGRTHGKFSGTQATLPTWTPPEPVLGEDGLYRVILNDFERPADFSPLQARRYMTVTAEKKTVHSGTYSAKLICKKENKSYMAVSVAQPLNLDHRGDFGNFRNVKKVSFWVYNAQDKAMDLTALLKLTNDEEIVRTTSIPPREWFEVEITINAAPSGKVKHLSFSFQPSVIADTVFYIDDICLYRASR